MLDKLNSIESNYGADAAPGDPAVRSDSNEQKHARRWATCGLSSNLR